MSFEVGERLYWPDAIALDPAQEPGPDAPERYATVTAVEDDGTVHIEFDDGLVEWMDEVNVEDYFERVTWDHKTS